MSCVGTVSAIIRCVLYLTYLDDIVRRASEQGPIADLYRPKGLSTLCWMTPDPVPVAKAGGIDIANNELTRRP